MKCGGGWNKLNMSKIPSHGLKLFQAFVQRETYGSISSLLRRMIQLFALARWAESIYELVKMLQRNADASVDVLHNIMLC